MTDYWQVTDDHKAILCVEDPNGWHQADIRFDGCVHYRRFFNKPRGEDEDYLHICQLEEHIERMQELVRLAKGHFGEHWPL